MAKDEVRALVRAASLRGRPVPHDLVQLATGHPYLGLRAAVAHAVAVTGDHALALEVLGPHEPIGTDYTALFGACLAVETLVLCGAPAERLEPAVEQIRPYVHQFATYGTLCSAGLHGVLRRQRPAGAGSRRRGDFRCSSVRSRQPRGGLPQG